MGKLVVLEGIDGSGKSTQVPMLAERLRRLGYRVHSTCEPTRGPVGLLLRQEMARDAPPGVCRWAEMELLLAADRMQHVCSELHPRLADHDIVLCDRYVGSGYTYGLACRPPEVSYGQALAFLNAIYAYAPVPEQVILLDLPAETAHARAVARNGGVAMSRYDRDLGFLQRARTEYVGRAHREGWTVVDADAAPTEVAAALFAAVECRMAIPA